MDENKITKLPKWTQDYISTLERELKYKEQELEKAIFAQNTKCSGKVSMCIGNHQQISLEDDATIAFKVNDSEIRIYLNHDTKEDYIEVNGNGGISILPRACNSIHIKPT